MNYVMINKKATLEQPKSIDHQVLSPVANLIFKMVDIPGVIILSQNILQKILLKVDPILSENAQASLFSSEFVQNFSVDFSISFIRP